MVNDLAKKQDDCATQNRNTKSKTISQVVRLVRKAGLNYEDWRYVSKRVREKCELKPNKKNRKLPNVLTNDEFRRFYKAVDKSDDVQHLLMLRLLFYTGVRVSELCSIMVSDVDLDQSKIRINDGKGGKDRYVLFGKSFSAAIKTHIAANPRNRWLFQSTRHNKFSPRRIQQIVKRYAEIAGVKATPHTFRHQAISWLTKKSGMADAELQLITGHTKRETLAIYQHVALDDDVESKYQDAMREVDF